MNISNKWKDYECMKTGNGEKLERWKKYYSNKTRSTNNME